MSDVLKIVNWFRVISNADMRRYEADELTQMKVMQLLYYVQGAYLSIYGCRAFSDDILASSKGPSIIAVQEQYRGQMAIVGQLTDTDLDDYDYVCKQSKLLATLTAVWDAYGELSTVEITKQTHAEQPWRETKLGQAIDPEVLQHYFTAEIVQ